MFRSFLSPQRLLLGVAAAGIAAGAVTWFSGNPGTANSIWALTTVMALVPLALSVGRNLWRGDFGVDLIALLAMAGALLLGEYLAGSIIALMLTGGQVLEDYAARRARSEMSALLERAPRFVHRYQGSGLITVPIDTVKPGDRLLVRSGEVIPVDGILGSTAVIDESTLTGEALPADRYSGEKVHSGTLNAGDPFDLRATATSRDSTYAGIVRLVEEAQRSKAPFTRLADRYALYFLPVTLGTAALAWAYSGDPLRALAVLVVATPCPLILAAPVAIVSGLSRCARHGIIVKGGGALEALAEAEILLLDKTGTITRGRPEISEIFVFDSYPPEELLRLAASLDQASTHILAESLVRVARARGLPLIFPEQVREQPGIGIRGQVDGREVAVGKFEWVTDRPAPKSVRRLRRRAALEGASNIFVSVDGRLSGALLLEDPIRPESPWTIRSLRRAGIKRVVLLTGDHPDVAEIVGSSVGADLVLAERHPAEKVEAVLVERRAGKTVMVGDGINDAPALAAADVGIALGARGATASSEAADVVLLVDRLDRLERGMSIAQRTRRIALQSVVAGMGLSLGAMMFAAAGFLTPVAGAFIQEGIDVAVILNALRALRERHGRNSDQATATREAGLGALAEHQVLLPRVKRLRELADRLDTLSPLELRDALFGILRFLTEELLPHETREDRTLYPLVARLMGGEDPTGTMSRAHLEIAHLIRLFEQLVDDLPPEGPDEEDVRDLRRVLYGLDALLRLHFAQEEEHYFSMIDARLPAAASIPSEPS